MAVGAVSFLFFLTVGGLRTLGKGYFPPIDLSAPLLGVPAPVSLKSKGHTVHCIQNSKTVCASGFPGDFRAFSFHRKISTTSIAMNLNPPPRVLPDPTQRVGL